MVNQNRYNLVKLEAANFSSGLLFLPVKLCRCSWDFPEFYIRIYTMLRL